MSGGNRDLGGTGLRGGVGAALSQGVDSDTEVEHLIGTGPYRLFRRSTSTSCPTGFYIRIFYLCIKGKN